MAGPASEQAAQKLQEAEAALQQGDRQRAYALSAQATDIDSRNVRAWVIRGRSADGLEDSVTCFSRALAADPNHAEARQAMHEAMTRLLQIDGSLTYLAETDEFYNIRTGSGLLLTIPKERAPGEPYPPPRAQPVRRAYRWLTVAWLGLLLAGLITFVTAPLAVRQGSRAAREAPDPADRVRGWIAVLLALLLACLAAALIYLFALHVLG